MHFSTFSGDGSFSWWYSFKTERKQSPYHILQHAASIDWSSCDFNLISFGRRSVFIIFYTDRKVNNSFLDIENGGAFTMSASYETCKGSDCNRQYLILWIIQIGTTFDSKSRPKRMERFRVLCRDEINNLQQRFVDLKSYLDRYIYSIRGIASSTENLRLR